VRASTEKNYYGTSQQYLTALEGLIDSEGSSVSVGLDNFYAALSEASSTPESIALRQQILSEAKQLAQRFNGLNANIGTQLRALEGQRVAMVSEINGLSSNIAELNAQILEMESSGRDTATLRDYRENLIKDLSQYAGIRAQEAADGSLGVSLVNGQPLVAGTTAGQLQVSENLAGEQELTLVFAKTSFPLIQDGLGGSLGALYDMEYGALRPAQDDLHAMADALAQAVNDTLAGGFDLNGNPGQPLFVYNPASTSGMLAVGTLSTQELALVLGGRRSRQQPDAAGTARHQDDERHRRRRCGTAERCLRRTGRARRQRQPAEPGRPSRGHHRCRTSPGPARQRQRGQPR